MPWWRRRRPHRVLEEIVDHLPAYVCMEPGCDLDMILFDPPTQTPKEWEKELTKFLKKHKATGYYEDPKVAKVTDENQ